MIAMIEQGALEALLVGLDEKDTQLVWALLGAIDVVLDMDEKLGGEVADVFEKIGGLVKLEALQYHENQDIYKRVIKIMGKHFKLEECTEELNQ